jgi:hypothetical protein
MATRRRYPEPTLSDILDVEAFIRENGHDWLPGETPAKREKRILRTAGFVVCARIDAEEAESRLTFSGAPASSRQ